MTSSTATLNYAVMTPATSNESAGPQSWRRGTLVVGEASSYARIAHRDEDLLALYALCQESNEQRALERAISTFERLLRAGRFTEADALLEKAQVRRLGPSVLVGILTITFHGKDRLPHREGFLRRAESVLYDVIGKDRAERLLTGRR